jgi:hypothetical protein
MELTYGEILAAAGVLLGFQVTSFTWRISREVDVGDSDLTWLPIADMLNLASMLVVAVGVLVLPILNVANLKFMRLAFGLALLLFIGYPFALAGHYDMYNRKTGRSMRYFPFQEKMVAACVLVSIVAYLIVALK